METFNIGNRIFRLTFCVDDNGILGFFDEPDVQLSKDQDWQLRKCSNPVEIQIAGHKTSQHTGDRHICTSENETLRYQSHKISISNGVKTLVIKQKNAFISVESFFVFYKEASTFRCYNKVTNCGLEEVTLEYVSSFAKKCMIGYRHYDSASLSVPHNSWFLECQWKKSSLKDLGIVAGNEYKNFKKYIINNTGAWSSKSFLPMGILGDPKQKEFFLWQIEANGSWSYELGDFLENVSLNLSGPSLEENGWAKTLARGESFETVKVAITKAKSEMKLFGNITRYRRAIVHNTFDHPSCPIIFNEYMLASWNCPSDKTAHELAPTAKKLGAEYYVIDCGWHDEVENPFYHLGRWNASKKKYPNGLEKTMEYIASLGLKPGLWLEPEVVGAEGDAITMWTPDCYFHRFGKPLIVSNRYQLNFANPKVTDFFYKKIDELVNKYHARYFKFDYNIEPGIGFEMGDLTLGEALLEHNRAYHAFMDEITKRYPDVMFEGCASGGNRLDYLTLDNVNVVSTSDQTNYLLYPYITSNILTAVLPTQAAVWCYPKSEKLEDKDIDYELINMNIVNCLIGRVHLASKLYLFSEEKQDFIKKGMEYYHTLDEIKNDGVPYYPQGLSSIGDVTLAYGLKNDKKAVLMVYNLVNSKPIKINIGKHSSVRLSFPLEHLETKYEVNGNTLIFYPNRDNIARVFEIEYE